MRYDTRAGYQDEERKAYYEAFTAFDWNNNGKISYGSLISAMRRAGINPTEVKPFTLYFVKPHECFHRG